jgi:hypothetical protein
VSGCVGYRRGWASYATRKKLLVFSGRTLPSFAGKREEGGKRREVVFDNAVRVHYSPPLNELNNLGGWDEVVEGGGGGAEKKLVRKSASPDPKCVHEDQGGSGGKSRRYYSNNCHCRTSKCKRID